TGVQTCALPICGKVLFQGNDSQDELGKWQNNREATSSSSSKSKSRTKPSTSELPEGFANWPIIGSDEVGNGSYFGSLTVCSVYLSPSQFELVKLLGVKD